MANNSTLFLVAGGALVGLYFIAQAGAANAAPQLPAPSGPLPSAPLVTREVTVEGRKYRVTKLGGGMYRVERLNEASQPVSRFDFGQDGPIARSGDPALMTQLEADIQKFPANLFE